MFVPILGLWPVDKAKRFPHGTIARLDFQREGWLPHMQPCPGKRVQINLLPPPNILHESYWTSIFSDVEQLDAFMTVHKEADPGQCLCLY